jgi:hypothetical protein
MLLYETMILREEVRFKKGPVLDLGKRFQKLELGIWNAKLHFYKQNL